MEYILNVIISSLHTLRSVKSDSKIIIDSNMEQLRCNNLSRQKTRCKNNDIILPYGTVPTQKETQICSTNHTKRS